MVSDCRVVGFVVKVAEHDDVGLRIGGEQGVDALAQDVGGFFAKRLFVEARGPVVHENVQVAAVALELGLDDVAGVVRIDVVELRRVEREDGGIVDDRAIDAAFAGRILVDDFVFAAERFELFDQHFDDLAVFDFAHAEHVGALAVVHFADDFGEVLELDVEPFLGPMLGRLGRIFFVAFDRGVVLGVEQVFDVPAADEEFVGMGGFGCVDEAEGEQNQGGGQQAIHRFTPVVRRGFPAFDHTLAITIDATDG